MKGFAVTLTLGIIASMFSALLFTRTGFRWMVDKFGLTKITMLDLVPKRTFDFLGKRWIALVISLIFIGGSVVVLKSPKTGAGESMALDSSSEQIIK